MRRVTEMMQKLGKVVTSGNRLDLPDSLYDKVIFKGRAGALGFSMGVLEVVTFGLFALTTLGASLGVVLVRDVWHSALLLGVALLSVAVHYVMVQAAFVAAMQVLVYVGGVLILITFAIMLTRGSEESTESGVTQ